MTDTETVVYTIKQLIDGLSTDNLSKEEGYRFNRIKNEVMALVTLYEHGNPRPQLVVNPHMQGASEPIMGKLMR